MSFEKLTLKRLRKAHGYARQSTMNSLMGMRSEAGIHEDAERIVAEAVSKDQGPPKSLDHLLSHDNATKGTRTMTSDSGFLLFELTYSSRAQLDLIVICPNLEIIHAGTLDSRRSSCGGAIEVNKGGQHQQVYWMQKRPGAAGRYMFIIYNRNGNGVESTDVHLLATSYGEKHKRYLTIPEVDQTLAEFKGEMKGEGHTLLAMDITMTRMIDPVRSLW